MDRVEELRLRAEKEREQGWPTPELGQKGDSANVELYGFTNQDLDASDAVWEFFLAKE